MPAPSCHQAQVEEIRLRQQAGLIDPGLDPRLVRLLGFAPGSYPRLLSQITRMTTGAPPEDPRFTSDWEAFLRHLGGLLDSRRKPAVLNGDDALATTTIGHARPE